MEPSNEEESARILAAALNRLPPAWVLLVALIGGSGVFSGAWFLGLDTRPNPWTSVDAEKVHARQDAEIFALRADLAEMERTLWNVSFQHAELNKRYIKLEDDVREHHEESTAWIERIKSNTIIILDNQKARHSHGK